MSILRTTGLVAGHYECRSLSATLPVFTDLLAMEIVEQKAGEATLKHPNTDWRLIVHEGGPDASEKGFDNHYGFRVATMKKSKPPGNTSRPTKKNTTSAKSPNRRARTSPTRSIFANLAAITWKSNFTIPAARAWPLAHRRPLGKDTERRAFFWTRLCAAGFYPRYAPVR